MLQQCITALQCNIALQCIAAARYESVRTVCRCGQLGLYSVPKPGHAVDPDAPGVTDSPRIPALQPMFAGCPITQVTSCVFVTAAAYHHCSSSCCLAIAVHIGAG